MFSTLIWRSKLINRLIRKPAFIFSFSNGFSKKFEVINIMPPKRKVATQTATSPVKKQKPDKTDDNEAKIQEEPNKKPAKKQEKAAKEKASKKQENGTTEKGAKKPIKASDVKEAKKQKEKGAKKTEKETKKIENESDEKETKKRVKASVEKEAKKQDNESDEQETKKSRKASNEKQAKKPEKAAKEKETKKEKAPTKKAAKGTKKAPAKAEKAPKKAEAKPALLNAAETMWDEIDFGCEKKNSKGQEYNLKITSWNVDGLRAWLKKDGLSILTYDNPDILCLQETKCSDDKLPEEVKNIEGYHDYWCAGDKEGYAGVGIYTKNEPLNVKDGIDEEEHDAEGRCLTLEFKDFYLVNVYVPNAGRGLKTLDKRLDWNESFKKFIKELDEKKPVILCGDMNVAHNEIDLTNPKTNKKNAGFTQEERDGMTDFLEDGYVDSFRQLYPETPDVYTFWSYMNKARSKNIGWRLDYFILSKRIMDNVCDNVVRTEVFGSDHCPISLFINI